LRTVLIQLTRHDRRVAIALFVLALGSYAYTFGGGGWNQNATFALVRSIVESQTFAIDAYAKTTGDVSYSGGHVYSNKPPGVAFLAVPVYAALLAAERAVGVDPTLFKVTTANAYVCTVAVCGVLGALIPAALFLYGRMSGLANRRWLMAVALVIALGTPLFGYATALFVHVPSASLLFLAFVLAASGRPVAAGFLAGLATATNYLCGPPAALIALCLLPPPRLLLRYAAGAVLPLAALAAYQSIAFGSFMATSIAHLPPQFTSAHAFLGVFRVPEPAALWGVTFSPYRGLFFTAPILLLAVVGIAPMFRRARPALLIVAGTTLFFLLANASFNGWWGGHAISARYLLPIVPFLGVLLLYADRVPRVLFAGVALLSIALQTMIAVVDVHVPADIQQPLTAYIVPQLVSGAIPEETPGYRESGGRRIGHVAVNPYSVTTCGCRSLWSSFNLGEKLLGQGSLLSILPLLLWMIGGTWLLFRYDRAVESRELSSLA
jgi:hypothetical protein